MFKELIAKIGYALNAAWLLRAIRENKVMSSRFEVFSLSRPFFREERN